MKLPSKELLEEIYKFEIKSRDININNKNEIIINIKNDKPYIVNIYQLLFKIKNWAKENGYELLSGVCSEYHNNCKPELEYICIVNLEFADNAYDSVEIIEDKVFLAETELEAILSAAEWIKTKI